jgi:hypothetical protein
MSTVRQQKKKTRSLSRKKKDFGFRQQKKKNKLALDHDMRKAAEIEAVVAELGADGVRAMAVAVTEPIRVAAVDNDNGSTESLGSD